MNTRNARQLRKNATECERLLWRHLRAHRFQGYKFRRQQPLGPYIVDFICFETRCVIEADGGQHAEALNYDAHRDAWLREQGFTVLRFWNNEVLNNLEGILERILVTCQAIAGQPPPSPQPFSRQGRGAERRPDAAVGSPIGESPDL
jgi:very-short-patch-repair endonuclease